MRGHEITLVAAFHFSLLFVFIFLSASSPPPTLSHYLSSHPHYCSAYLPMQSCHKVHHKRSMSARLDCAAAHISHNPRFIGLMLGYLLLMPTRSFPSSVQLFLCHKTKVICYPPPRYVCDSCLGQKRQQKES